MLKMKMTLYLCMKLVILGSFAFCGVVTDPSTPRVPFVGIATDPVAYQPVARAFDPQPETSISENPPREPGIDENQEVASPGFLMFPAQTPSRQQQQQVAPASLSHRTTDPQASNNTGSPVLPGIDMNDMVLLSIYTMNMDPRALADQNASQHYEIGANNNCSDLACLYATEPQVEEMTTEVSVGEGLLDEESEHIGSTNDSESSLASNSETNRSSEVKLVGIGNDIPVKSFIIPEAQDGVDSNSNSGSRILRFQPVLPILLGNRTGETEISVFETNSSRNTNKKKPTIEHVNQRTLLPGYNITREIWDMDIPDIVPLLRRCGVFLACDLKLTAADGVINNDAHAYEKYFSKQITTQPEFMQNVLKVTCDPTSVSIVAAFAILLAIIIVASNIVIIAVTLRTKSLRRPHGYFKISLAVADFINGAFVLTSVSSNIVRFIHFNDQDRNQITQLRRIEPKYSEAAFFGICAVLSQVVTVYSVLLLSVDSFLSIRWPMQYRVGDLMTVKRAWTLIGIVWVFALAVSALPVLAYEYVRYGLSYSTFSFLPILEPLDSNISHEDKFLAMYIHVILYAVLVWGIPFLATWVLTVMTAYHSRGMLKSMSSARKKAPGATKKIDRLERDILRTVVIVLVMLTLTVLPMLVCLILAGTTAYENQLCIEKHLTDFLFAAYYILVCGSFMNVIVYNACHKEFRRATFDLLCDVLSVMFSCICPDFRDIKSDRHKSFRSKSSSLPGTRRTIVSDESRKIKLPIIRRTTPGQKLSNVSNGADVQTNLPVEIGLSASISYHAIRYPRANDHSESIESDAPTSSRTISTITSSSTTSSSSSMSSRNRSISSETSDSSNVNRKIPAQRAASCLSVFTTSNHNSTGVYSDEK